MQTINIYELKTHFSKFVDMAMQGEEIIITKLGKPVARLCPLAKKKPKRAPGVLKNKVKISKDFDAPLPEDVLKSFKGCAC